MWQIIIMWIIISIKTIIIRFTNVTISKIKKNNKCNIYII